MSLLEPIVPRTGAGRGDAVLPAARRAAMLAHPTLAVAIVDGGRIRQTNAAWRALFALPHDVTVESHVATLFPSAGLADRFERTLQAAFAEIARGGVAEGAVVAAPIEQTLVRRDGKPVVGELVVTLLRPEGLSNPFGGDAIWQIRDITVERTLRRELRELGDYHRELSRHQGDMTFVIDRKARIAYASASVEGMLGHPVDALLGEPFVALLDPSHAADAEQWLRTAARHRAGDDATADGSFHLHAIAASGEPRVLSCRTRDCFDSPRVAGMIIHARDVTQRAVQAAAALPSGSGDGGADGDDAGSAVDGSEPAGVGEPIADSPAGVVEAPAGSSKVAAEPPRDTSATRLVALARVAAALDGVDAVPMLVEATRQHLHASVAVFTPVGNGAGPVVAGADPDDASTGATADADIAAFAADGWPTTNAAGDAAAQVDVVADVHDAALDPDVVAKLVGSGVAAFVAVPTVDGGDPVGSLVVASTTPRCWSGADVSFVFAVGLLIARALAPAAAPEAAAAAAATPPEPLSIDPLGGLPGRGEAHRRIAARVADVDAAPWSLLLLDIDRLRDVNAVHGYAAGDAVVTRVAQVVAAAAHGAFAARVDGGSFVLIVDARETHDIESLATGLVGDVANAMRSNDALDAAAGAAVDASVGVVHCLRGDAATPSPLARAELALAEAKRRGGGRAVVVNAKFVAALRARTSLDAQIAAALDDRQFTIFYQPQIALQSGAVVGLEALVRWQHPQRGLLLPDAFMELAFDRGLIDAITKFVLTEVCGQIAAWRREGAVPELPVSVNVSGRQFHDRRLPALVASALLKSGLPARLLMLEITEQSLVGDDTEIDRVVKELSRLGVRIAIGDFNAGHASFRYLRQLQVSQVKLDRGFIRQLPGDAESTMVVGAVVDLARRLKYQVVAEGVETAAQFEHLRANGCEVGQGFHFGAPLSAVDIRAYLAPSAPGSATGAA